MLIIYVSHSLIASILFVTSSTPFFHYGENYCKIRCLKMGMNIYEGNEIWN